MNSPAQYLHVGFILISQANLIVIALLIIVFALAVTLRFPEKQHFSTLEAAVPPQEAVAHPQDTEEKEVAKAEVHS